MYKFSSVSEKRLESCHVDLIDLFDYALNHVDCPCDFTVVCGVRGKEAQEEAFKDGFSKAKFGHSPHNYAPSLAIDVAPYVSGKGIAWDDIELFTKLANHIKECAKVLEIDVLWGGDWTSFKDYPHWELKGWRNMDKELAE